MGSCEKKSKLVRFLGSLFNCVENSEQGTQFHQIIKKSFKAHYTAFPCILSHV